MQNHEIEMIPLSELEPAKTNARRLPAEGREHDELMASIAAHGVLSSLVVRRNARAKASEPRYAVVAGGRRLRALRDLAARGTIAAGFAVPCRIQAGPKAADREVSLAENTVRAPMHPVDRYEAFRRLTEDGASPAAIAERFGTTARTVEQYLRLADVHEEILAAATRGELETEALMAFAASADTSRQLDVWNHCRQGYGSPHPGWIRGEMLREHLAASHARARLVGLEAYQQAGGRIERDLFAKGDDDTFLTDVRIVDELATARLEAVRDELRGDWGWAEAALTVPYHELQGFGRIEGRPGALTAGEQEEHARLVERIAVIEAELDTLHERAEQLAGEPDAPDSGGDASGEEIEERQAALAQELHTLHAADRALDRLKEQRAVYDPAQMKHAGVLITVADDGSVLKHAGLVREADAADMPARSDRAPAGEAGAGGARPDGETDGETARPADGADGAGREPDNYQPPTRLPTLEERARDARGAAGFGGALGEDMKVVRTSLVKLALAGDFEAAFDLAAFQLAESVLTSLYTGSGSLQIASSATAAKTFHGTEEQNDAVFGETTAALEALRAGLPLDWLDAGTGAERFRAFRALGTADRQRVFAAAVAWTLKPQLAFEPEAVGAFEETVARLDVPFARGFRPTARAFWGRVTKANALAAARAVLGDAWADAHAGDRKAELAAALEAAFAAGSGPADLDAGQRERALAWTAPGFRAFDTRGLDPAAPAPRGPRPGPAAGAGDEPEPAAADGAGGGFDPAPAETAPAFLQDS